MFDIIGDIVIVKDEPFTGGYIVLSYFDISLGVGYHEYILGYFIHDFKWLFDGN
jgi:hypothetical protein